MEMCLSIYWIKKMQLSDAREVVDNILNMCVDTDVENLPDGVEPKHIYQVKMNSYVNTSQDSVSMNLYFKGHKEIKNSKYYSIDNLTVENFMVAYNAIYMVQNVGTDIFSFKAEKKCSGCHNKKSECTCEYEK